MLPDDERGQPSLADLHRFAAGKDNTPTWRCEVCHDTLNASTNDGTVYFSYSEWHAYRKAKAAWEEAHRVPGLGIVSDGRDLADYPELSWHVVHDRCDRAAIERYDLYWIAIERLDSWAKVADWSAHLHGKEWFADTDWGGLLYGAGIGSVSA